MEDSLFDTPPEPATNPGSGENPPLDDSIPSGEGEGSPDNGHAAAAGMSRADVEAMIAPVQADLLQTRQELANAQQANNQLQTQISTLQADPDPEPQSADDFITDFSDHPEQTIQALVEKGRQETMAQLAPILNQHNDAQHQTLVANHKTAIDAQYGSGTWDEEFDTPFQLRAQTLRDQGRAQELSSHDAMKREVDGLKGLKIDTLHQRQAEHQKSVTAADAERKQEFMKDFRMTGMSGSGQVAPLSLKRPASDEEKAYLDSAARDGEEKSLTSLREAGTYGSTLTDYQKAQAAKGKK